MFNTLSYWFSKLDNKPTWKIRLYHLMFLTIFELKLLVTIIKYIYNECRLYNNYEVYLPNIYTFNDEVIMLILETPFWQKLIDPRCKCIDLWIKIPFFFLVISLYYIIMNWTTTESEMFDNGTCESGMREIRQLVNGREGTLFDR